jgi:hypothetical protein
MKKPPDNPEFTRFTEAMRHIMGVSKSALVAREEATRKTVEQTGYKKPGPKPKQATVLSPEEFVPVPVLQPKQ